MTGRAVQGKGTNNNGKEFHGGKNVLHFIGSNNTFQNV